MPTSTTSTLRPMSHEEQSFKPHPKKKKQQQPYCSLNKICLELIHVACDVSKYVSCCHSASSYDVHKSTSNY